MKLFEFPLLKKDLKLFTYVYLKNKQVPNRHKQSMTGGIQFLRGKPLGKPWLEPRNCCKTSTCPVAKQHRIPDFSSERTKSMGNLNSCAMLRNMDGLRVFSLDVFGVMSWYPGCNSMWLYSANNGKYNHIPSVPSSAEITQGLSMVRPQQLNGLFLHFWMVPQ